MIQNGNMSLTQDGNVHMVQDGNVSIIHVHDTLTVLNNHSTQNSPSVIYMTHR